MPSGGQRFATLLVQWQRQHGRHDLPWQGTSDPYRVWLSEIMLQQTQVATVKVYFARFMERFPDVAALAAASEDEVLGLWSGLGYYTRARNLHRCARMVVAQYGGHFPSDPALLEQLPGIGRSTAAAIASLCFAARIAILDANVRRVVSRVTAFANDLSQSANVRALWDLATGLLPAPAVAQDDMPSYTQGLMDLGAMVCQPRQPHCESCPVASICQARASGDAARFPVRTRTLRRSSEAVWMLFACTRSGGVYLIRRPASGIWAGLYCLPTFASEPELRHALGEKYAAHLHAMPVVTHVLTHKDLHLHALCVGVPDSALAALGGRWFSAQDWPALGLPAPVRRLLESGLTVEFAVPHDGGPALVEASA